MSSNAAISLPPSSLPVILATAPTSPETPPPPPPVISPPPPPPPVIPPPSPSPPLPSPPSPVILNSPPPPTPVTPPPSPSPPPPVTPPSPLLSPPPPSPLLSPPPPPPVKSPPPPTPVRSPPPPPPPPSPQSPSSSSKSSLSIPMVAGISAGAVIILVAVIACFLTFCRKKARPSPRPTTPPRAQTPPSPPSTRPILPPFSSQTLSSGGVSSSYDAGSDFGRQPSPSPSIAAGISTGTFTYEEMAAATNGFSDDNLLGQGGFGHVYRGTLNGMDVAIKKLRAGSGQGDREFHAEVEIISRVHHKNLVSLVGFCIAGDQRLLAYEYVPNKTLEFHLHGSDRTPLDWPRRWKIALTSAKGLAYLHDDCHPKIIHRDIKTANILLDFNFEAKVADFGLAKIQSGDKTQVSTRIMGTFGYLAPEYASSGKVTYRSDVFSYGVVLLELISGRRPVQSSQSYMDETLVGWAKPLIARAFEEDNYEDLVDPRLGTSYDSLEMARLIECAAAATRHSATHRPRMSQIIRYLEGDIAAEDLNAGIKPGQSSFHGTRSSAQDSGNQSEIRRFKKLVFGSQEYTTSGEYSEPTSEYGLNQTTSSSGVDTVESEPRGRWRKDK